MIYGNGIDAQEISGVAELAKRRPRFIDVVLTPSERAIFETRKGKHQWEFLAGRFSAKEAYSKALGTGIGSGVSWQDLEILYDEHGAPALVKHPRSNDLLAHVSISHTGDSVHTSVILETFPDMHGSVSTHRPAWLEISQSALTHNVQYIRELTGAKRFMAVVKANAYGHGSAQIVTAALAAGVDAFGVATLDEALWLRQFGVDLPILVLGVVSAEFVNLAAENHIVVPLTTMTWLEEASANLMPDNQLLVAIAVDTGMTRIGLRSRQSIEAVINFVMARPTQFDIHSIGMHFATADTPDIAYWGKQLARWHQLTDGLTLPEGTWRHLANSGTALWHQNPSTDAIRVGAGMYGFDPSQGTMPPRDLKPVMTLKAGLVQVKQVEADVAVSYGATYHTTEPTWIGTVPVGYADGYARQLQGYYGLLPDGRHVEIIGRIAMDQMMVKLPEKVPVGTVITLIGQAGGESITLVDLANRLGTIPYEVATGMAARLPRQLVD
ncbi:alanine racemase [Weissella diestrammenae]|uniref:Multifunctional fusion protein n=1 Tax=Weissella diestrammenae TaxID=1162633 RepID=A0A7G9T6M3_9LACO|nr:alanine racemase [Weissella diestrammenae]MCM0582971.1 alanine racemase [Weissella diestrammenae]QNN75748.1 alanine racemase [Weissella diestrammenae]